MANSLGFPFPSQPELPRVAPPVPPPLSLSLSLPEEPELHTRRGRKAHEEREKEGSVSHDKEAALLGQRTRTARGNEP